MRCYRREYFRMFDDLQINCPPKPMQTETAAAASPLRRPPRHPNVLHGTVASDALSNASTSKIVSHDEASKDSLDNKMKSRPCRPICDIFYSPVSTSSGAKVCLDTERNTPSYAPHRRAASDALPNASTSKIVSHDEASKDLLDNKMKPRPCRPICDIFCS
jgi:hypothetical protein